MLLDFLNHDFLQAMKWRLRSSPFPTHTLVFAAVGASTVFSFLQGLLIVAITALFLEAYWGNLLVTCLVILMVSLTSQLLLMTIFFFVRSISITETLSWAISLSMMVVGGVLFPMPQNAFFTFMERYGTPYALARTAIIAAGIFEPSTVNLWLGLGGLAASIVVLGGCGGSREEEAGMTIFRYALLRNMRRKWTLAALWVAPTFLMFLNPLWKRALSGFSIYSMGFF